MMHSQSLLTLAPAKRLGKIRLGYPLSILSAFVTLHIVNALLLSYLFSAIPNGGLVIALRGVGCMIVAVVFALWKGFSLRPKMPRIQFLRLFVGGAAITLSVLAFKWIDAGSAMIFARYDVVFLALAAVVLAKKNYFTVLVCLFAFLTPILLFQEAPVGGEDFIIGSFLGMGGGLMMAVSYYLLSSSGKSENISVTTLVPGVASVIYGAVVTAGGTDHLEWNPLYHILALAAGAVMFLMYYFTVEMYRHVGVAKGEYPTVIAAILTVPLASFILGTDYSLHYVGIILVLAAILIWIIRNQERLKREH